MARRWSRLLLTAALASGACTGTGSGEAPHVEANAPGDLLVVDTADGVRALDPSNGRVVFDEVRAVALADRSEVFTSTTDGRITTLRTIDVSSGRTTSRVRVAGRLRVGVVSAEGPRVALVEPATGDTSSGVAQGRASTPIAIVDPSGLNEPIRFRLDGNFEPEAFSTNGQRLYLIQYLPATAPELYRVTTLDLSSGKVWPVLGPLKEPPEKMSGTRVVQVLAPDGETLYTLYTNQNAAYSDAGGEEPVAFVHALSLEYGWAFCIDLPGAFGPGPASAKTIAVSPGGARLYAVDAAAGIVSVIRTGKLRVTRSERVDLGSPGDAAAVAGMGEDGTLYVGSASQVASIDPKSLAVQRRWPVSGTVTGLGVAPDGGALYVSSSGRVLTLDASTGAPMASIATPGVTGINFVEPSAS